MSSNQANILGVIGAPGSGKSTWVKQQLATAGATRLVVWDFKREYRLPGQVTTTLLKTAIEQLQRETFCLVFEPDMDPDRRVKQFALLCQAVRLAGRCVFVVEELAFVTSPGRAPPAWRMLTLTGRHDGLTIIGTSQRPASIDKDFLGNCTLIHSGRVNSLPDVQTMARMLMVPADQVAGLQNLEFIERDTTTGAVHRGKVNIPRTRRT